MIWLGPYPAKTMRTSLTALLLTALLCACASNRDIPVGKQIDQKGALKVHPDLLGQAATSPAPAPAPAKP